MSTLSVCDILPEPACYKMNNISIEVLPDGGSLAQTTGLNYTLYVERLGRIYKGLWPHRYHPLFH